MGAPLFRRNKVIFLPCLSVWWVMFPQDSLQTVLKPLMMSLYHHTQEDYRENVWRYADMPVYLTRSKARCKLA